MPDNGGVLVHVGDTVTAGQQIGIVDSNGESTGNHLHMEIWTGGNGLADSQNKIDGAAWLSNQGSVIPALGTSGPIKVQS
jgi:murein DD-endopeptidase MepM/ murein hydrolase activator NlpD